MHPRRIFTFWEPRGAVPAYLQLCRETWDAHRAGIEVVVLDHANLEEHIGKDVLDLAALRKVPLAAQKDAVLVAVLHARGGLFLDMDTLVCGDLAPIFGQLRRAEMVKFGPHLGVVAARPGGALTGLWLTEVQEALRQVAADKVATPVAWDFVGYLSLERAIVAFREQALHRRLIRSTALGREIWRRVASRKPSPGKSAPLLQRLPRRFEWELSKRHLERHLVTLDRKISIAENGHQGYPGAGKGERFVHFWLESDASVERVIRPGVNLVQLHNSWMPDWYLRLNRDEVLAHHSRLSAVLRYLLDGSPQEQHGPGVLQGL